MLASATVLSGVKDAVGPLLALLPWLLEALVAACFLFLWLPPFSGARCDRVS